MLMIPYTLKWLPLLYYTTSMKKIINMNDSENVPQSRLICSHFAQAIMSLFITMVAESHYDMVN